MRWFEHVVLSLAILAGLAGSGVWLWTESSHYREAVLTERLLTGKYLEADPLMEALTVFSAPEHDLLPGKHLFYQSMLAAASAERSDIPKALRLRWLDHARETLPDALIREPANAHAWTHLAYAIWLFKGPNRKTVDALRMSMYAAPTDTELLPWRLKLAGSNRDFWDPRFQDLLKRQVWLAWRNEPGRLVEMAAAHHLDDVVREVLTRDPVELARFEHLLLNAAMVKQKRTTDRTRK